VDYLVNMTTHVPDGTAKETVDDVRTREAAHTQELAREGHILRLWRPPLQPGEWRTLGLFAAGDSDQLEKVLASMPLRLWRKDEVTPLFPHPNDPALAPEEAGRGTHAQAGENATEFLITLTIEVPPGTPAQTVDDTKAAEARRAQQLAEQGHLERLWSLSTDPADWRVLGLWRANGAADMQAVLKSLPLYPWTAFDTTPLTPHPSDPGGG
jgi:muconolactone delta-isomerase